MPQLSLINQDGEHLVANNVLVANTFSKRLIGLIGKSDFSETSTLWFDSCDSVHSFFMKFSIGVVFVDRNLKVKKVIHDLHPWRMTLPVFGAQSAFEFSIRNPAYRKLKPGDQLHVGS